LSHHPFIFTSKPYRYKVIVILQFNPFPSESINLFNSHHITLITYLTQLIIWENTTLIINLITVKSINHHHCFFLIQANKTAQNDGVFTFLTHFPISLGWSIAMQAMGTQPLQKSTRIVTLLQISFLLACFLKIYKSIPILYKLFSLNPLKVTKKKKREFETIKPYSTSTSSLCSQICSPRNPC